MLLPIRTYGRRQGHIPKHLKTQIIKFVVNKLDKYQKLLGAQKKALGEALKVLTDTVAIQEATAKVLANGEEIKQAGKYICNIGKSMFVNNVIDMLKVYYINKTSPLVFR